MKKENIGKMCFLKTIKLIRTHLGGTPHEEDYMPFIVIGLTKDGYLIQLLYNHNTFKVKTEDIYFKDE